MTLTVAESDLRGHTVCIDFDGVLLPFSELGLHRELLTQGEPTPGSREALERLRDKGFRVVIHSSRSWAGYGLRRFEFTKAMRDWLVRNQIPFDDIHVDEGKPPAIAYIDDLAIRFDGDWPGIVDWVLFSQ